MPDSGGPPAPYVYEPSAGAATWSDAFDRPDSSDPGNAWIDKMAGEFAISANHVTSTLLGSPYGTIAIRPQTEKQRDVEVSVTFTLATGNEEVYLFARALDLSTDPTPGMFSGYRLRVSSPIVELQQLDWTGTGNDQNNADSANLTSALLVGHPYRAFLRVTGDNDVLLEAGIFEIGGASPILSFHGVDKELYRNLAPGRVGFAARQIGTTFDDFERRDLL